MIAHIAPPRPYGDVNVHASGSSEPYSPPDSHGEIKEALSNAHDRVTELFEFAYKLRDILSPIMLPVQPQPAADHEAQAREGVAPLANEIDVLSFRIEGVTDVIRDILKREQL
jgi:hypothetical protein